VPLFFLFILFAIPAVGIPLITEAAGGFEAQKKDLGRAAAAAIITTVIIFLVTTKKGRAT